jgi:hypothetical protein
MTEWAKVITHPLGLAGFTLFIVFSLLIRRTTNRQPRWLKVIFTTMALIALIGGLFLAYERNKAEISTASQEQTLKSPQSSKEPEAVTIELTTKGPNSPAVAGVKGDVKITIEQQQK